MGCHQQFLYFLTLFQIPARHGFLKRGFRLEQYSVIGINGHELEINWVRLQERKLETVFGTVSVERAGYGQEATESLHPLDAELNLPNERYLLELRRRVAE
jgi:hypothetical protein